MPVELPDDRIDAIGDITGVHVTIFRWVPADREFVREATTIQTPNGRAVGTLLARGAVYDAMMRGQPFFGEANILGLPYVTYYHPVLDASGAPIGIFFAGTEVAEIQATIRSKLVEKLTLAAALLAGFLVAITAVIMSITRPLARSKEMIERLKNSDLSVEITDVHRADEVGAINGGLQVLRSSMIEAERVRADSEKIRTDQKIVVDRLTNALADLARLDLTTYIHSDDQNPFPREFEDMRMSFNTLVDSLNDTIQSIRSMADRLDRSADALNSSASNLSERSTN
jgi:methyl-accepting chemotaxis protein